jgi:FkbM family methyltransferase
VSLYGQEPEAALLASFIRRLEHRTVIDVGAERGAFVDEMLRAGSTAVHAIEPEPANVASLTARFEREPRVIVHQYAASDADGELLLRLSITPDGTPVSFGHTTLERPDTDQIGWGEAITVPARSLSSLVGSRGVPQRVGVLKIDTEGHDLAVIHGMGDLECDVVMVEHWNELPGSLGRCPWTTDEMSAALGEKGFSNFAFVVHLGEVVIVQWNDGEVPVGHMGNLIFLHDRVSEVLVPEVLKSASALGRRAAGIATARAAVASAQSAVIAELRDARDLQTKAAVERLAMLEELTSRRDNTVQHLRSELESQARAASERLETITRMAREHDLFVAATAERMRAIDERGPASHPGLADHGPPKLVEKLRSELEVQTRAAAKRREVIEAMTVQQASALEAATRERDIHRESGKERLVALEDLRREHDRVSAAAEERLETIRRLTREHQATVEELSRELELQSEVSRERLDALEDLKRDRDLVAQAAEERLAALEESRREHEEIVEQLTRELDLQASTSAERLAVMETLDRAQRHDQRPDEGWR